MAEAEVAKKPVEESTTQVPEGTKTYSQAEDHQLIKDLRSDLKKLRDEKTDLAEAKRKSDDLVLEEQGKYKDLYEPLNKEAEALRSEVTELKEKQTNSEKERREELIARLPENMREFAKDLPLGKISELGKFETKTFSKDKTKNPKQFPTGEDSISEADYNKASDEMDHSTPQWKAIHARGKASSHLW